MSECELKSWLVCQPGNGHAVVKIIILLVFLSFTQLIYSLPPARRWWWAAGVSAVMVEVFRFTGKYWTESSTPEAPYYLHADLAAPSSRRPAPLRPLVLSIPSFPESTLPFPLSPDRSQPMPRPAPSWHPAGQH